MIRRRAFLAGASAAFTAGNAFGDAAAPAAQRAQIEELRAQAATSMARGDTGAAIAASTQALDTGEALIRSERLHINESAMHDLIAWLAYDAGAIYTLAAGAPTRPGLAATALRCSLARKGRFTREEFIAQSAWAGQDPVLNAMLLAARRRFTAAVATESEADMEAAAQAIITAQDQLNAARANLLDVPIPASDDVVLDLGVDSLVSGLNLGRVLLVYVEYDSLSALGGRGDACYLGIVAQAGAPVAIVPLGAAADLEPAIQDFATGAGTPGGNWAAAAQAVHGLVVAPLTKHFASSPVDFQQTLLISPDGALFLAPFAALRHPAGTSLFDLYSLQMLDSPLQASIAYGRARSENATNLIAFANPALPADASDNGFRLLPLQEAGREAAAIAALWQGGIAQVFTGTAATPDELIRQAPNAGILHIACHGEMAFNPVTYAIASQAMDPAAPQPADSSRPVAPSMLDASLSRSILVLAPSADDAGYFSALEAAGLDLGQTQLVCLSACSTGTGDFERGEGIYGLRSAFLAAGAESMVSVLWEADDAVTETLMVTYYQLMFQGNSRADALRNAMAAIKQTHPHPFYWAGFVFSGVDSLLRLPAVNSSSW